MDIADWSTSEIDYGRKVLKSGLEGAHSGREAFLKGKPLTPFIRESIRSAWKPAAFAACIGALGSLQANRHRPVCRALAYGLLGGAIGFGAAVAWDNRYLTASALGGALKSIGRTRDEHWLERHPIDYA